MQCGQLGHFTRDCRQQGNDWGGGGGGMPGSIVTPTASSRSKLHHSGSDKNRSSCRTHCKGGIWRNGDCHDVGLGVLNFTHLERCAVTCSWSYEGVIHFHTAAQDSLRRASSGTEFCMQLDRLMLKHNFVVVYRLVVRIIFKVDFLQQNGLAVDFATKAVTVRSSSKLNTALGHGSSLPRMHYLPGNEASSFKEIALDEHASGPTLAIGCSGHSESSPVHCKTNSTCWLHKVILRNGQKPFSCRIRLPHESLQSLSRFFLCVWICSMSCTLIKARSLKVLL